MYGELKQHLRRPILLGSSSMYDPKLCRLHADSVHWKLWYPFESHDPYYLHFPMPRYRSSLAYDS